MNQPIAEIFSQGEEVISGQVADTNAAWLSQQLIQMGFVISRHTAVGDKLPDLVKLLQEISVRADLCICTGGLGPTVDDLTAEAVAQAFDCPLQLDEVALQQIERYFLGRGKPMAHTNRKQAYFPTGAVRIDNAWGTAPGFAIKQQRCWFVFVPGVPSEMRQMYKHHVKQDLSERFVLQTDKLIAIKTIGIGESDLQQKLNNFVLPENVSLSFRAAEDEVQTKLLFPAQTAGEDIKRSVDKLVQLIGDPVFAVVAPFQQQNSLETDVVAVIGRLMNKNNWSLSVVETASQGLIASKCIAQDWLQQASYQQINDKEHVDNWIEKAVSIAEKQKQQHASDVVLVQLFEGNKQQFQEKEKFIVLYNVLLTPNGMYQSSYTIAGPIKRKQNQAAIRALDLLRRVLQNRAINTIK